MNKDRIIYSDILRISAAFFVILIHVTSVGISDYEIGSSVWQYSLVLNCIARWSVPVFFMVSGIFFLDPERNISIENLFFKYIVRIVWCIVIWGFFYSLLHQYLYGSLGIKSLPIAIYGIITDNTGGYHLWFLYTLIILYLETPILRVFTTHATKRQMEYALWLWLICSILLGQMDQLAKEVFSFNRLFSYSALTVTGYSGYYLLGHYLHRYPLHKRVFYTVFVLGALSVVLMPLANVILAQALGLRVISAIHSPLGVGTCLIAVAIFSLAQKVDTITWSERAKSMIIFLSRNTFGVYLLHVFFVSLVFRIMCLQLTPVWVIGWSMVIYVSSGLVAFLFSNIPIVRKIV